MKNIYRKFVVVAVVILAMALMRPAQAEDRKVKTQIEPVYPELAKSMHLTGTVRVEVTVNEQGTVKDTKVVGGNPVLADAAVKAVQKWKFEPGPQETKLLTFDFKGN
ncbi:MAG: energy transducer TonB [Terriglobia bacterium]|jgi:TonB family protein|nr:energy transducer TonB [Terriglobia bacterium]